MHASPAVKKSTLFIETDRGCTFPTSLKQFTTIQYVDNLFLGTKKISDQSIKLQYLMVSLLLLVQDEPVRSVLHLLHSCNENNR